MAKKLTYEEVKNFVEIESNSGCKLLSTNYKNSEELLLFQCKCDNEFTARFTNFVSQNKRQCNGCGKNKRVQKM